jgi:hypothetical protein
MPMTIPVVIPTPHQASTKQRTMPVDDTNPDSPLLNANKQHHYDEYFEMGQYGVELMHRKYGDQKSSQSYS